MESNIIEQLINIYNELCIVYNKSFQEETESFEIIFPLARVNKIYESEESKLSYLANYVDWGRPHFPFFDFMEEFYLYENIRAFGYNSQWNLHYAVLEDTKEIVTIDDMGKLDSYCAINEEAFIRCIIALLNYELYTYKIKYNKDTAIDCLNKCISLSGGDKYKKLYSLYLVGND